MLKELFSKVPEPFNSDTLFIVKTYMEAGYECWVVGGPIRDLLLGLSPKDIDLATNCPLEVTKELFKDVIPTGESHGNLTVHLNGENYEVTRKEITLEEKVNSSIIVGMIECDILFETVKILEEETINSCLVGGAVRDSILGFKPKDWDFVTSTPYDDLKQIFINHGYSVKETGANFLILMVVKNDKEFEIANYRCDQYHGAINGRHPTKSLPATIQTDSLRRDFGINSLYFSLSTNTLLDPTGQGFRDFYNKEINFIGNVKDRLKEDNIRALRLCRFEFRLNKYGFKISKETKLSTIRLCEISSIAIERIYMEIDKMMCLNASEIEETADFLFKLKLFPNYSVSKQIIKEVLEIGDYFPLVKHIGVPSSKLKLPNEYDKLLKLFDKTSGLILNEKINIKHLLTYVNGDYTVAKKIIKYHGYYIDSNSTVVANNLIDDVEIKNNNIVTEPFLLKHLEINGTDLLKNGKYKGADIQKKLNELLLDVKRTPKHNTRIYLLKTL